MYLHPSCLLLPQSLQKNKLFSSLFSEFDAGSTGTADYVDFLIQLFLHGDASNEQQKRWVVEQLFRLCRNRRIEREQEWVSRIVQLMVVHALFQPASGSQRGKQQQKKETVQKGKKKKQGQSGGASSAASSSSQLPAVEMIAISVSKGIRESCANRLLALITDLVTNPSLRSAPSVASGERSSTIRLFSS